MQLSRSSGTNTTGIKEGMIAIIDNKTGNIGSIANMLKKINAKCIATNDVDKIKKAGKIILPGVGKFDKAVKNMKELNLLNILNEKVLEDKTPILGICLGMHLLADKSEEGVLSGLGWIKGSVERFSFSGEKQKLKVPHMGWNRAYAKKDHPLLNDLEPAPKYYFVHSYHFVPENEDDILCHTLYGNHFVSAVAKGNILGVQFHPEKSHKFGMSLLKNFVYKL